MRISGRSAVFALALSIVGTVCEAGEIKLAGTWIGFEQPIYTKLVISDDGWLTYCAVSSCRAIQCFDMAFEGELEGKFTYDDGLRSWKFERVSQNIVRGQMTTASGTAAVAQYEPETPLPLLPTK